MTCSQTAGRHRRRPRPRRVAAKTEQASVPLRTIADTARQTLGRCPLAIDALGAPGDDAPAPGVADMDALFERMQQAGLPVRVQQLGSPGALSPVSELSAHRIVQEALTNALVDGAVERGADVSLDWQDAGLAVTVVSRATGEAPVAESGRGVTGMQERARLAGGWLCGARRAGELLIVTAYLPARTRGGEDEWRFASLSSMTSGCSATECG